MKNSRVPESSGQPDRGRINLQLSDCGIQWVSDLQCAAMEYLATCGNCAFVRQRFVKFELFCLTVPPALSS